MVTMVGIVGCRPSLPTDVSKTLIDIEARFADAKSAHDFQAVAASYDELISTGHESALIWYNRGLALLEGGDKGRAIASLRRAEQLRPRDTKIIAALRQAGVPVSAATPSSLQDALLGLKWTRLSLLEKTWCGTAIMLATMTCGWLCMVSGAHRAFWGATIIGGCLASGILGASIYESYYQTQRLHAVVTEDTTGHRGPAVIHEQTWPESLPTGTEVKVLESTPEWIRVEWFDHGEAWVRSHALERY